jgi:hypothetical protein
VFSQLAVQKFLIPCMATLFLIPLRLLPGGLCSPPCSSSPPCFYPSFLSKITLPNSSRQSCHGKMWHLMEPALRTYHTVSKVPTCTRQRVNVFSPNHWSRYLQLHKILCIWGVHVVLTFLPCQSILLPQVIMYIGNFRQFLATIIFFNFPKQELK